MNTKNLCEEEITLAPQTEIFEEAKRIAQETATDEKFSFTLHYDANQKDFLLSMLETVGAIVEDDDEEGHLLTTQMNMAQLAFIKQLDAVERVKTDEGINPFLAEEAVKLTPIQQDQQEDVSLDGEVQEVITDIDDETLEVQTELVVNRTADANLEVATTAEAMEDNDGIAVASVTANARSSCSSCPTNTSQSNAQNIAVETLVSGCICCPGAEQWFKFTVPSTKQYTIFTTGSLDTEGELSGCCLATPIYNDDFVGRVNFRIVETLCAGYEYYIKVGAKNDATGSYTLKVTEQVLAESVTINSQRSDGIILLEQGKTYELPRGEGYGYLYNDGELDANDTPIYHVPISVGLNPAGTNEKRVYWYASSIPADPVDTGFDWYNNTTKYQTITANSCGAAKLYAYDWFERGKHGEICVVVAPSVSEFVKATSFKICKEGTTTEISALSMEIGAYQRVVAEISPSTATVKNVNWVSTNPEVATITPSGRIKAVSHGTTTIRAEAMDGSSVYGCCDVTCSSHIYRAVLTNDGSEYTFTCATSQCNEAFTVPKDQVVGSYVTSSTDSRLGNSQTPLAYGIDISSHQEEITQSQWNEIASTQIDGHPIAFVILRIGREVSNNPDGSINRKKDEQFENNYVRAKAAGLQVGCYYYTESWSPENALADAEQVIEWIGDKQFEYPVFFDIESNLIRDNVSNNTIRTEICTAFMNKMREAGFFTGLYTNAEWITDYLNSSTLFPKYDVWYARYREGHSTPDFWGWNQETTEYKWPQSGRKFGMWQYTKANFIAPIPGNVDCDVAYKNYPLIIKALHLNNFN